MHTQENPFENAEVIYSYSRAQAIEDGVLVDVSSVAKEAGIKFPVAMTMGSWVEFVKVPRGCEGSQDEAGRLWDVLWMARSKMAVSRGNRIEFKVKVMTAPGRSEIKVLTAHVGPGDQMEPVVTIMMPGED